MRRLCLSMIALCSGLAAVPAHALPTAGDTAEDCFDVAAPMAEATPCWESGRHRNHHHARRNRNAERRGLARPTLPTGFSDHGETAQVPRSS